MPTRELSTPEFTASPLVCLGPVPGETGRLRAQSPWSRRPRKDDLSNVGDDVILEVHDDVYEAVGRVAGKRLSSPLEGRDPVFDAEGLAAASRYVELVDERGVRLSVLEKHRYLLS